ncbi:hypothetical protein BDZ97DRAFT_1851565 [Flammula alnicola]|nr:hypothetical protein BDZ97DRAFT_1851565 [Flammula alnicola]
MPHVLTFSLSLLYFRIASFANLYDAETSAQFDRHASRAERDVSEDGRGPVYDGRLAYDERRPRAARKVAWGPAGAVRPRGVGCSHHL